MVFLPCTTIISVKSALVRSEVRRRRWLLPPLVRTKTPDPVRRNLLEVALWVFNLYLPVFCFPATANSFNKNRGCFRNRELYQKNQPPGMNYDSSGESVFSVSAAFFFTTFDATRIMLMVRPSIPGACSMVATSESSSAISLKSSKAISG